MCESSEASQVATGLDFEYFSCDDSFAMHQCKLCGNIYLNPRPTQDELSVIYPSTYYSYNYSDAVHPLARMAKDFLDSRKIRKWVSFLKKKTDLCVLDVGCGDGRYLKLLHERHGVPKDQLFGVEMSEKQIACLNSDGFRGFYGTLSEVAGALKHNQFDLIVLLQVLEHLPEPLKDMQTLAGMLRPGGVLIVETPNTNSVDFKLFKRRYWGGYHFPRHWNLFNESVLKKICDSVELKVVAFNYLPAQTFWIYSLHNAIVDHPQTKWMARFLNPFQNIVLLCIFTAFDIIRAGLGFKTSNIQLIATRPL